MAEERVLALKAIAADDLKAGRYGDAIANYEEAMKLIDKTHQQYLPIFGNKVLACVKAERWQEGLDTAKAALMEVPNYSDLKEESVKMLYQKILYRRGVCEQALGRSAAASASFGELVKRDPSNTEAARRLAECTIAAKKARKRFGDMFGGDSMYDDRVRQTELRKAQELKEYEENHEEGVSFEEWRETKERVESAERQEKQKKNPPRLRHTKSASSGPVELEVDEEDKKILEETKNRGYCYFKRELTEDEKKMKESVHVPQKLDETSTTVGGSPPRVVSSWNNGTTYEEKDMTGWCKEMLEKTLAGETFENNGLKIETENVEKLNGDAQIMVVRSGLRHFFDFSGNIKFSISDQKGDLVARGTLVCDSITGAVDTTTSVGNYLSSAKAVWNIKEVPATVRNCCDLIKERLNTRLAEFHSKYKEKN